jgi:hypothetical protein
LSAAFKACNVYPQPIFDYDLARFSMMAGKRDVALQLFRKFISDQATSKMDQLDNMLLQGRDIEAAVRNARSLTE